MPTGQIGDLTLSRLISGGNLISGWAHSRDLHYVPSLMRAYNTDEKGVGHAAIARGTRRQRDHRRPREETDGDLRPLLEGARRSDAVDRRRTPGSGRLADQHTGFDRFRGGGGLRAGRDWRQWYNQGKVELLGKCVEFVRSQKVPAGIGAHKLEVIVAAEKLGLGAEFYVKTTPVSTGRDNRG
jgi:hypothetical protein